MNDALENMNHLIAESNVGIESKLSLAFGYAFGSHEINTFIDLFNAADKNMYRNKKSDSDPSD